MLRIQFSKDKKDEKQEFIFYIYVFYSNFFFFISKYIQITIITCRQQEGGLKELILFILLVKYLISLLGNELLQERVSGEVAWYPDLQQ